MRKPVGLVTTFGLARTPAQVGMLKALQGHGIDAEFVVGTSLGAINAAAYAAGRTPAELEEFWLWMDDEILGSPVRAMARGVAGKSAARQEAVIRARLADILPRTFEQLPKTLRLVATDLCSGDPAVLESGDLLTAVLASCALPGLLPPVAIGSRHYIDGGLVAGMPLLALPDEVRSVVVLDTGHSATTPEIAAGYRWWEVGALAYAHQIREQAVNALRRTAIRMPVVMISTDTGRLLDFGDTDVMIEAGEQVAQLALDGVPSRLRRGIYGLPGGLDEFDRLRSLQIPPTSG